MLFRMGKPRIVIIDHMFIQKLNKSSEIAKTQLPTFQNRPVDRVLSSFLLNNNVTFELGTSDIHCQIALFCVTLDIIFQYIIDIFILAKKFTKAN